MSKARVPRDCDCRARVPCESDPVHVAKNSYSRDLVYGQSQITPQSMHRRSGDSQIFWVTTVCQTPWHLRMGGGSCSSQSFSGLRYYDRNDDRGMARDARANLRRRGLDLRHRALELRLHRLLERIACDSHGASQQRHHHNHRRVTVTTTTDASP